MKLSNEVKLGMAIFAAVVVFVGGVVYLRGVDFQKRDRRLSQYVHQRQRTSGRKSDHRCRVGSGKGRGPQAHWELYCGEGSGPEQSAVSGRFEGVYQKLQPDGRQTYRHHAGCLFLHAEERRHAERFV